MAGKKLKKEKEENKSQVNERAAPYTPLKNKHRLRIYKSFEEQEEDELSYRASLSPLERLEQLRKLIDLAYGIHGYNPNNLPKKHSIKIEY